MANDETGYPPVPFDITPFSLKSSITKPHKPDWVPGSFRKAEIIHLRILQNTKDLYCQQDVRSLDCELVLVYYRVSEWGMLDTRPTPQHRRLMAASIWNKAKIFRAHPVRYHPFLKKKKKKKKKKSADLVWTRASNPTIRCLTFVLNKSWVLSYLRHRNSPLQKLLRESVQALGETISGILWVNVS